MKSIPRIFAGSLFILLGALLLLRMLNILTFSLWETFKVYWPVLIILAGISIILDMKWLSATVMIVLVVFAAISISEHIAAPAGDLRTVVKEVPVFGVDSAEFSIDYGLGNLSVHASSDPAYLVRMEARTTDDPSLESSVSHGKATVSMDRANFESFRIPRKDSWDIGISKDVPSSLEIDVGAAEMIIDLRDTEVYDLALDTGASSTDLFLENPINVTIDTGASSIVLHFPPDANARIYVEGGAISTDFPGFIKVKPVFNNTEDEEDYEDEYGCENTYLSRNYDPSLPSIDVSIDAGASDISSKMDS